MSREEIRKENAKDKQKQKASVHRVILLQELQQQQEFLLQLLQQEFLLYLLLQLLQQEVIVMLHLSDKLPIPAAVMNNIIL